MFYINQTKIKFTPINSSSIISMNQFQFSVLYYQKESVHVIYSTQPLLQGQCWIGRNK